MNVNVGKSYHIKDEFFQLVDDQKLMRNREFGHYRPHYFVFADPDTDGIYWAIPQSKQTDKYQQLIHEKTKDGRKCDTIVIGNYGGVPNAFLIQNMFPIIPKFVDHEHTIGNISVNIHKALSDEILSKAKHVLRLHKRGIRLVFPDIDHIYRVMKNLLETEQ